MLQKPLQGECLFRGPTPRREPVMEVLGADLRCLDAHAHLGNLAFERSPERAIVHNEIGVRTGASCR